MTRGREVLATIPTSLLDAKPAASGRRAMAGGIGDRDIHPVFPRREAIQIKLLEYEEAILGHADGKFFSA